MLEIYNIKKVLSSSKKILITTHLKPDGDAIGSALGLYHFLKEYQADHQISVIVPSEYPDFLHFLAADSQVMRYPSQVEASNQLIDQAEVIFILDYSTWSRADEMQPALQKNTQATRIVIDHHLQPNIEADYLVWDEKASSAAELVFQFIDSLEATHLLNSTIAQCIATGIISDTGRFKYNTNANTLLIMSQLLSKGVDIEALNTQLFDNYTEARLRFIGFCLTHRLKIWPQYRTAVIHLSLKDFADYGQELGSTGGLVNYPLMLSDIQFVVLMKESETKIKMSLRSRGDFSVNDFARKHFSGGGHKNASGGRSLQSLEDTLNHFEQLLPMYKDQLSS